MLTYWANFFHIWPSFLYLSLKHDHTDKLVLNLGTQVKCCQVCQIKPSQFLDTTQACPSTRNYREPPRTRRQSNIPCLNVRNLCYKNHPYTHRLCLDGYQILNDFSLLVKVSIGCIVIKMMKKMIFLLHTCHTPEKDRRCEGLKQVLQKFLQLHKNHPYTHRLCLDGYQILNDFSLLVKVSIGCIVIKMMKKMIFLLHTCHTPEKDQRCEGLKQVLQKFLQLLPSSKFPDCPARTWEWHALSLSIESLEADGSLYPRSEGTNILAQLYVTSRPMLIKKCILWVPIKVEIL